MYSKIISRTLFLSFAYCNLSLAQVAIETPTIYTFTGPKLGAQSVFDIVTTTVNGNIFKTVESQSIIETSDDGFATERDIKTASGLQSNTTLILSNKAAQRLKTTIKLPHGGENVCIYKPHGGGAPANLQLGQSWDFDFSETCSNKAEVKLRNQGVLTAIEPITVPAGTFMAYKFQSITTGVTASGMKVTGTNTFWRNADVAVTGTRILREEVHYEYAGKLPIDENVVSYIRTLKSYH